MASNLGTAFVQVLPDLDGFNRRIGQQLKPLTSQTSKLGTSIGNSIGGSASKEIDRHNRRIADSFSRTAKRVAVTGAGLVGAYAGIAKARDAVETTTDLAKATLALHRNLGLTTKSASQWAAVAKARNVDTNALNTSFTQLSKSVIAASDATTTQAKAFKDLGFTQEDIKRGQGDFNFLIKRTAEGFGRMEGGAKRATLGQTLLGRSVQNTLPIFTAGRKSLEENLALARKYGVQLSGGTLEGLQDLIAAQKEWEFAQLGMKVAFTRFVAPTLKDMMELGGDLQRIFSDDKLDIGEKFEKAAKRIEKLDIGGKLAKAIENGLPIIADAAAHAAPAVVRAFVSGWLRAGLWGKLVTTGWLLSKMGAFAAVGKIVAKKFVERFAVTAGADLAASTAASGLIGSRFTRGGKWTGLGRTAGKFVGRGLVVGIVAGIALYGDDIANEIKKHLPGGDRYTPGRSGPSAPQTGNITENLIGIDLGFRKGGKVRRFATGGVLSAVSSGELLAFPDGSSVQVPGQRVAADNVLTSLPVGTAVFTGHGQSLLAGGASPMEALARQMPHFASGGTVAMAAKKAGFRGAGLIRMVAEAGGESSWNERAVGDGGASKGLWQIHTGWNPWAARLNLFDPFVNAKAARRIWRTQGYGAWHADHTPWIGRARAAVASIAGQPIGRGGTGAAGGSRTVLGKASGGDPSAFRSAISGAFTAGRGGQSLANIRQSIFRAVREGAHRERRTVTTMRRPPSGGARLASTGTRMGLIDLGHAAQRMGLHVGEHPAFGGVDPVHVPGSYHYQGRAIDVSGATSTMARFANATARTLQPRLLEEFWRGPHWVNIKNGQRVGYNFVTGHQDHVHVAMRRGGRVGRFATGGVAGVNATGATTPQWVRTARHVWRKLKRVGDFKGGRMPWLGVKNLSGAWGEYRWTPGERLQSDRLNLDPWMVSILNHPRRSSPFARNLARSTLLHELVHAGQHFRPRSGGPRGREQAADAFIAMFGRRIFGRGFRAQTAYAWRAAPGGRRWIHHGQFRRKGGIAGFAAGGTAGGLRGTAPRIGGAFGGSAIGRSYIGSILGASGSGDAVLREYARTLNDLTVRQISRLIARWNEELGKADGAAAARIRGAAALAKATLRHRAGVLAGQADALGTSRAATDLQSRVLAASFGLNEGTQGIQIEGNILAGDLATAKKRRQKYIRALEIAKKAGDKDAIAALTEDIAALTEEIGNLTIDSIQNAKDLIAAKIEEFTAGLQQKVDLAAGARTFAGLQLEGLELDQKLAGTFDTQAGQDARAAFIRNTIIPSIQGMMDALKPLFIDALQRGDVLGAQSIWNDFFSLENEIKGLTLDANDLLKEIAEDTSEQVKALNELLKQQLQEARLRYAVSQAQYGVFSGLPHFADGGVVPGPVGAPRMVVAHGGETITPPGQGIGVTVLVEDGAVDPNKIRVIAQDESRRELRRTARSAGRALPGRGGGLTRVG